MTGYLIRRLLWLPPTLFGLSLICFALLHLAPGDPGELLLRQSGGPSSAESAAQFKAEMGLDKSLLQRYRLWLGRAVRLDLGESFTTGEPVRDQILSRMPATIKLALTAFGLMLAATIPIGLLSALRPQGWLDQGSRLLAVVFASLPNYWFGLLLMFLFARYWQIFNIVGHDRPADIILPALTLALGMTAVQSRLARERFLAVLSEDYIRTALAKGLNRRQVFIRHALKNALAPLLHLWGASFGYLLGGSILVETVFAWPGAARLAVDAVLNRDYPVVQGYVILMALIFVGVNLAVDLGHALLDPRIRQSLVAGEK